jgi:hypothetical protein
VLHSEPKQMNFPHFSVSIEVSRIRVNLQLCIEANSRPYVPTCRLSAL